MELDPSVFRGLLDYLNASKQPASQILGMVFKRGEAPDLSKRSWINPRLHHLVMKFALVSLPPDFPFTSVQILRGAGKFDTHNKGQSYVVRFGSYTGGELVLKEPHDTEYNILHRPMIFDATTDYYFKEYEGTCWTLIFYTVTSKYAPIRKLSDYEAVYESNKWSIAWHRPGEPITYLSKKFGLINMTKKKDDEQRSFLGRVKKTKVDNTPVDDARYTAAQNLMMRASVALNTK